MSNIQVKPAPTLDRAAWPHLKHPVSGGLLDAAGSIPDEGRPWLNDGFTARMLTDGAIIREDHPAFAPKEPERKAEAPAGDADKSKPADKPAKFDPAR